MLYQFISSDDCHDFFSYSVSFDGVYPRDDCGHDDDYLDFIVTIYIHHTGQRSTVTNSSLQLKTKITGLSFG
jgi:hypothetical protein